MNRLSRFLLLALSALAAMPVGSAKACAVCMGADSNTGEALNGAIFMMLGCIFAVLGLISAVGIALVRRAHRLQSTLELSTVLDQ